MSGFNRFHAIADGLPPLPQRLLAGLSGGADSVALFRTLLVWRERGGELGAVHVNHGLRGEDSDEDERFVRRLCEAYQVPLQVFRASPPACASEAWAREARYGFFRQAIQSSGAEAVALAHHMEDQAETLLLHLLRGAGLTGLSGMPADGYVLGVRVVRPLLTVPRQALREALTEAGQSWREDASNQDNRFLRNALRHELLPMMERLAPGCASRMAASASLLREEETALAAQAEDFLTAYGGQDYLALHPLTLQPLGMRRRILRLWWSRWMDVPLAEHSLSRDQTDALSALLDAPAGSRCNLPGDCHGQRGWTHLHLLAPSPSAASEAAFPGVTLTVSPQADAPGDGRRSQAVPAALWRSCEVRLRRPGDWIRPYGQQGRQSLQDYFVNRKVDAPFRGRIPLVCRGGEVLLAAGVGAGDIPPFETSQDTVTLRWEGDMPWARAKG